MGVAANAKSYGPTEPAGRWARCGLALRHTKDRISGVCFFFVCGGGGGGLP